MNASFKPKAQGLSRVWRKVSVCLFAVAVISISLFSPLFSAEAPKSPFIPIVKIRSEVPPDARTARSLGTEREGSGV
ncbi:MAG: hypothetical protein V3W08_02115, partial [Candidatus Binatia bacterium]